MPKIQVSFLLLGAIHRDPLAVKSMREEISRLTKLNIPVLFCEEDFPHQTLEDKRQGVVEILKINSSLLRNTPKLTNFLKKRQDLYYRYFLFNDDSAVQKVLENRGLNPASALAHSRNILRHSSFEEVMKLTDALTVLKIPYFGIDGGVGNLDDRYQLSSQQIIDKEALRIESMASHIFTDALPQLHDKNGIIVVQLGVNHVRNLATQLSLCYKQNPALFKKYDIQIYPIKLFSPYVEDGIEVHYEAEKMSELRSSDSFTELYQAIHCEEILCTENPNDKGRMQLAQQFTLAVQDVAEQKETSALAPIYHDSPLITELTTITNALKIYRDEKTAVFFKAFDAREYNKALRIVCNSNLAISNAIISILIKNKIILELNPNQQAGDKRQNAFHLAAIKGGRGRYDLLSAVFHDEQMKDSEENHPAFYLTDALTTACAPKR